MRVMTGETTIDGVVSEFRLRLREEIVVAIPTQRGAGFGDEMLVIARMRLMAGHAIAIADRLMDVFLFGNVGMAFEAGGFRGFAEQAFEIRGVRRVAIEAIAGFDREVFKLVIGERIVVAIQAEFIAGLRQQIFIGRLVRVVTTGALAVFHRLMFEFIAGDKILVAGKAKLPRGHFRLGRHATVAVALGAFALGKRRVNDHLRAFRQRGSGRDGVLSLVCGRNQRCVIRRGICRHAVEEEIEPLAFRGFAMHHQNRSRAYQEDQGNNRPSRGFPVCVFISHWSGSEKLFPDHFMCPNP